MRSILFLSLMIVHNCQGLNSSVLITPSYGILDTADITAYENMGHGSSFNPMKDSGEQAYWQCFRSPKINVRCAPLGYREEWGNVGCDISLIVDTNNQRRHIYWMRRGMPIDYYHKKKILWQKITHNQEYVCFGGHHGSPDIKNGHIFISNWTFDQIKSKVGSDSYWEKPNKMDKHQILNLEAEYGHILKKNEKKKQSK